MSFKIPKVISLFTILLILNAQDIVAQSENSTPISVVNDLFDAMRTNDTLLIESCFVENATLSSVGTKKSGLKSVRHTPVADFIEMVKKPSELLLDEQLYNVTQNIDGQLATVWAPYTFYVGEKLSHCGTNAFQLIQLESGWKILHITDSRYRENCPEAPAVLIHQLMDNWHLAAATADEDVFFGSMTKDGIYLGTDESERWERDEMAVWAAPHFEKESAWSFTAYDRQVYFAEDGITAWFEEKLETWMGPCRGSGVVKLINDEWKIAHYNLAMLVPNDKVDGFLKLIGKEKKK